jgi:spore maturation protein CgeB
MKIVFSCLKYNHYNPQQGESFEYSTILKELRAFPDAEVIFLPYDDILLIGKQQWNKRIVNDVAQIKPDLFFAFMYTDEFLVETLQELRTYTKTLAWFSDDHWRIYNYSITYARYFDWVATTWSKAKEIYHYYGIINVIHTQWAAPHDYLTPVQGNKNIDVSFVGLWSKPREKIIKNIEKSGISVLVRGRGWPKGGVSPERIIKIFMESKINLALNPAPGKYSLQSLARIFMRPTQPFVKKYTLSKIANKIMGRSFTGLAFDFHFAKNIHAWLHQNIRQIKSRHFEVAATGGMVITFDADNLSDYYEPDKEIVIVTSIEALKQNIEYYLVHDEERRAIARAGQIRTLREHTYQKRFEELFTTIF